MDEAEKGQGTRISILHPPGGMALGRNPFGKDVANLQLWQALARHGGYQHLDVLTLRPADPAEIAAELLGGGPGPELAAGLLQTSAAAVASGTLIRGQPYLSELAWMRRRRFRDRAYSLVGMVHTLAPPAVREMIAASAAAPTHPWDALICTSPSVQRAMSDMFGAWGEHLAERTGGRPPPHPALPLIPLGVHAADLITASDRPGARAEARARLGLAEDAVLALWVGRLSYYEKAFPQPMLQAVQRAQAATGAKVAFVMAGWFPDEGDRAYFEVAARVHAPDVDVRFADGNDRAGLDGLWAGADIFLSLVDNIQETFGITPLEAMAAGLPVVASDWDGYRFTVRNGIEGFLIPTLGGPVAGGVGATLVERHVLEAMTYQAYVGTVAQHTAVHIGRAADALAELIRSPDLRRRMGAAGRARVLETFDWPVVARQVRALTDELATVRAAAADPPARLASDPVKGDPFRAFGHFATHVLTPDTHLMAAPGATAEQLRGAGVAKLDTAFPQYRSSPELCDQAFQLIAEAGGITLRDLLMRFEVPHRRSMEMAVAWMAKYGFVDWLT